MDSFNKFILDFSLTISIVLLMLLLEVIAANYFFNHTPDLESITLKIVAIVHIIIVFFTIKKLNFNY